MWLHFHTWSTCGEVVQCLDAYSCVNDTTNTTGSIQCYGYMSCWSSNILSASVDIDCNCPHSCSHSNTLEANVYIWGISLVSAAWIDTIKIYNQGRIGGEGSLYKSNSVVLNSATLICSGFRSCDSIATISSIGTSTILGYGTLSLRNSVIFCDNGNTLNITMKGLYSGYNTTIYCSQGSQCILNCFGNGCDSTFFICNNDDDDNDDATLCQIHANGNFTVYPFTNLNKSLNSMILPLDDKYNMILGINSYDIYENDNIHDSVLLTKSRAFMSL